MEYRDLRDFIDQLEREGDLKRISRPISTVLEITEISDRVLRAGGPALLLKIREVVPFHYWQTCSVRNSGLLRRSEKKVLLICVRWGSCSRF